MRNVFSEEDNIREELKEHLITPFSKQEKAELWKRIEVSIYKKARKTFYLKPYFWVAASICLILGSAGMLIYIPAFSDQPRLAVKIKAAENSLTKTPETVKLITVGGDEISFHGDEPEVLASNYSDKDKKEVNTSPRLNQLIVPFGKKSQLVLEDGSKIWINSDSKVTYPEKFAEDKREITVDGEIYADISHDKSRPFIVKSQGMQIEVLGTEFNLSAYSKDPKKSIILVSGKVEVETDNQEPKVLYPNSMLTAQDNSIKIRKNINVYDYICWKDDILLLEAIPISELVPKLNRHYGCSIISDKTLEKRVLVGKLDLKNPLEDILKSLAISLNCKYEIRNNRIFIKPS